MKLIHVFISFLTFFSLFGQVDQNNANQNFHKIYPFESAFALINDIYVSDTGYYFQGVQGWGATECDVVFGKLKLNGDLDFYTTDSTPNEYNMSYVGLTQMDTNFRGNFILGYTNRLFAGPFLLSQPNFTEIDKFGNIVLSTTFDFYSSDSLIFADYGKIIPSNEDSTYYGLFTYANLTTNTTHPRYNESGVLLLKIDQYGDTIFTKKFADPSIQLVKPKWTVCHLQQFKDTSILLSLKEFYNEQIPHGVAFTSKIHLILIDANGNILQQSTFQEGDFSFGGFTFITLTDGSLVLPYYDSKIVLTSQNVQERVYRAVTARIDSNMQIVWKDTLPNIFYPNLTSEVQSVRLLQINDSVFGGAYLYEFDTIYDPSIWHSYRSIPYARIYNKTMDGETVWQRDYHFANISDSINEPTYSLTDFEKTADGGFITCGSYKNHDSLAIGSQGIYGYVLKTNCLGFLGAPESAFSYQISDSFVVNYTNHSIQAGSYLWSFGDGDIVATDEYEKFATHYYESPGTYNVTLIAFGCNGEADTLTTTIIIPETPIDTVVYIGDGTLLTLFPNPVKSGESLVAYVGELNGESATLDLIDYSGKVLYSTYIPKGNTNYFLPTQYATGVYLAALRNNKNLLETERFIIE